MMIIWASPAHTLTKSGDLVGDLPMQATSTASADIEASTVPDASKPAVLHIVCDRDVGLFNLVQGVIPHLLCA